MKVHDSVKWGIPAKSTQKNEVKNESTRKCEVQLRWKYAQVKDEKDTKEGTWLGTEVLENKKWMSKVRKNAEGWNYMR